MATRIRSAFAAPTGFVVTRQKPGATSTGSTPVRKPAQPAAAKATRQAA